MGSVININSEQLSLLEKLQSEAESIKKTSLKIVHLVCGGDENARRDGKPTIS